MASQTNSTVEYYVGEMNDEVFLPGLQREFVWEDHEIVDLFDSLIRNYPVGAIVYWDVKDVDDKYTSYEFIQRYISDTGAVRITPEIDNRTYTQSNDRVDPAPCRRLIIDGQQRLTSLYIGLTGSILRYTAGAAGSRSTKEHWSEMELCINILGHPDGPGSGSDYGFKFVSVEELSAPEFESVDNWVDTENLEDVRFKYESDSEIWVSLPSLFDGDNYRDDVQLSDLPNAPDEYRSLIRRVMNEFESNVLRHVLAEDVYQGPADEVKDVFQRLNTKGRTPAQYQLLMSKMMGRWAFGKDACYPREEIVDVLHEFRGDFEEFNDLIDRQLVLRYLCYLHGAELRKPAINSLGQPSDDTLSEMKETWKNSAEFKAGLRKAFKTASELGFTDKTFDSGPILALVGRFYYESGAEINEANKSEILRFLSLSILLNEAYDIKRRSKARKMSSAMNGSGQTFADFDVFPTDELLGESNIYPTKDIIEDFVTEARYEVSDEDERSVFKTEDAAAVLGLLNDSFDIMDLSEYDVDHIFPRDKAGVVESTAGPDVDIHRIGNLQLLRKSENRSENRKGSKLPADWVTDTSPEFRRTLLHDYCYPFNEADEDTFVDGLSPSNYKEFAAARENEIVDALSDELLTQ